MIEYYYTTEGVNLRKKRYNHKAEICTSGVAFTQQRYAHAEQRYAHAELQSYSRDMRMPSSDMRMPSYNHTAEICACRVTIKHSNVIDLLLMEMLRCKTSDT
jgi:hypothetical protein